MESLLMLNLIQIVGFNTTIMFFCKSQIACVSFFENLNDQSACECFPEVESDLYMSTVCSNDWKRPPSFLGSWEHPTKGICLADVPHTTAKWRKRLRLLKEAFRWRQNVIFSLFLHLICPKTKSPFPASCICDSFSCTFLLSFYPLL